MIAKVLPATSTTAARKISKGRLFIATSLWADQSLPLVAGLS